jgi:hypothetical protein
MNVSEIVALALVSGVRANKLASRKIEASR